MSSMRTDLFPSDFVEVFGDDRVTLLQRLSTNDLEPLNEAGVCRSTVFTDDRGKTIDWVWLVSLADRLVLRTSAGRGENVVDWIGRYTIMEDVRCEVLSGAYAWSCIGVFGDDELQVEEGRARLVAEGGGLAAGSILAPGIAAIDGGVEIWLPTSQAEAMVEAIRAKGAWGLDADGYEGWRIRQGVPSAEREFLKPTNPLELTLDASIGWNKGCYIGQEVISRLDSYDKIARRLVGFELTEGQETAGLNAELDGGLKLRRGEKTVGRVTSVLMTGAGGCIGLAVVERSALPRLAAEEGDTDVARLVWQGGEAAVRLSRTPFARTGGRDEPR